MESKLTCEYCNGHDICNFCDGQHDLLLAPMSEHVARAILKAARDKCGGFVTDGNDNFVTGQQLEYRTLSCYGGVWGYNGDVIGEATEFAFANSGTDILDFLSSPRVTESLTYIFTPRKDNDGQL